MPLQMPPVKICDCSTNIAERRRRGESVPQKRTVSGAVRGPEVVLGEYEVTARGTEPHWTSWPFRTFYALLSQTILHSLAMGATHSPTQRWAAILASVRTKYVLP